MMFTESFNEVENFTITKLPLGGSKKDIHTVHNNIKQTLSKSNKQIDKVFIVKDKIIVKCENKSDVEEVHNIIKESSDKIVSAEIEKTKNPRIKIVGVHNLKKNKCNRK